MPTKHIDSAISRCLASSKDYTIRPETEELKKLGARLLYCAHSAHQRGIKDTLPFFEGSSTYNFFRIVPKCQNVLSFN